MIFNFVMDKLIHSVKTMEGYIMGKKNFKIVCCANDAVLIAYTKKDLQRLVYRFNAAAKTYKTLIFTKKN